MTNPTHKRFPRTLAEAFPRTPEPYFVDDDAWDGHKVLEYALVLLVALLPLFFWLI